MALLLALASLGGAVDRARAPGGALVPGAGAPAPQAADGATRAAHCRYVPSPAERNWTASPARGQICKRATSAGQVAAARASLAYAAAASAGRAPAATKAQRAALSRYECDDGSHEYIEPLTGVARHPFARTGCEFAPAVLRTDIFDLSYVLPSSHHDSLGRSGRRLLFDLGCSVYSDADGRRRSPAELVHGSARGPSMPFFEALYKVHAGWDFDALYGWEYTPMNQSAWWERVPAATRAKLHFLNVPIAEDGSEASFSKVLLAAARAEDFVALKVDIDNTPVELAIVHAIRDRPELAALVDEIYFENHFEYDGMDFGWHTQAGAKHATAYNVDDALALFRQLREKGVRAHFWI